MFNNLFDIILRSINILFQNTFQSNSIRNFSHFITLIHNKLKKENSFLFCLSKNDILLNNITLHGTPRLCLTLIDTTKQQN